MGRDSVIDEATKAQFKGVVVHGHAGACGPLKKGSIRSGSVELISCPECLKAAKESDKKEKKS